VAAVTVGLVVLATRDDGAPTAVPATDATDTTERTPSDTASPTIAPTTVPETTVLATTTVEPTTAPPTTLAIATAEALVSVLPGQADVPANWFESGDPPETAPTPYSGAGKGFCGGDNAAARALAARVVAMVQGPSYYTTENGDGSVSVYAFATAEDAASFMALTATEASGCFGGYEYQLPEGDGPDAWDGFGGDYGLDAQWFITDTTVFTPAGIPGADEAFHATHVSYTYTNYDSS
jgi:hypothetical protein